MLRTLFTRVAVVVVIAVVVAGQTGCPERDRAVEYVGGAPGRQVDDARVRANAAEEKLKKNAEAASAASQE